jgi:hypothetical protein
MKTERVISWFDKETELLVSEKNIDSVDLEILKEIFSPSSEDSLMYNPYDITESEAQKLNKHTDLKFEFDKYFYQVDCFQV